MKANWIIIFFLCCIMACSNRKSNVPITPRDTTITKANAVFELFFDSSRLEEFITRRNLNDSAARRLRNFYNSRNYQFAWFTEYGLAEQTRSFWNLHDNYIQLSRDSSIMDRQLHDVMNRYMSADTVVYTGGDHVIETELQLTGHFFEYAQFAYFGKVNPEELQWHIPRKKVNAMELLDSLIANKGGNIEEWEPVNRQYRLISKELKRYDDIDNSGAMPKIEIEPGKKYRLGDSSIVIKQVKQTLHKLGDFTADDISGTFTPELTEALKQAQHRFGHKQDGVISTSIVNDLNVPIRKRIEQMLINMERMRWMPRDPGENRIVVNIPEFRLHVFEKNKRVLDIDVVVGTSVNKTVIFNDTLKYVVFSPYWNIPRSIVRNEILPAMRRNSKYLTRMNMEQTGTSGGLPVIRQKPGRNNALGKVKFIFPNTYNIYFHDTPSKPLFQNTKRAFSHGCIRIAKPEQLAKYLLRDQPEWTADSIRMAMNASREKWVTLKDPVPVIITYLTSWVSNDGLLNFREDIYGHDAKMAEHLFVPLNMEQATTAN